MKDVDQIINKVMQNYPSAKRIAVENFLSTAHHNANRLLAEQNMLMDAKLYGWKAETKFAIQAGLDMLFASK